MLLFTLQIIKKHKISLNICMFCEAKDPMERQRKDGPKSSIFFFTVEKL